MSGGGALLLWVCFGAWTAYGFETRQIAAWNKVHGSTTGDATAVAARPTPVNPSLAGWSDFGLAHPALTQGQPVAKLEIAKISYTAIVLEGTSDRVISNGPGHDSATPYPGESGPVVVASHNTWSLGWAQLVSGDQITLSDGQATYKYVVDGSKVWTKHDASVFSHDGQPRLYLVTCWPVWAGNLAFQWLIVSAHLT